MVNKTRIPGKIETATLIGGPSKKGFAARKDLQARREVGVVPPKSVDSLQVDLLEAEESVDVIDLGAPRRLRRAAPDRLPAALARARPRAPAYTPNPRLYPGPPPKQKRKGTRAEGRAGRPARRRVFRRPVPNSRLYRPAPRRVPPPPQPPRGPWPPPAPARALDTASRAALRLAARPAPAPPRPAPAPPSRLVVTLPGGMDAAARHSTSPDDCSDGADALSAPSEFLAEFLSAIMRRQYAEALKYCRLILQYEPHNATARGFFPLLQHKVQALKRNEGGSSSSSGSPAQRSPRARPSRSLSHSRSRPHSRSTHEASGGLEKGHSRALGGRSRSGSGSRSASGSESGGSVASQSSLELDSSSASASAGASASASPSARSDTRSATRSRSDPDSSDARDDNGNLPDAAGAALSRSDDIENDNDVSHIKSASSSLRRLRAQFACSIK